MSAIVKVALRCDAYDTATFERCAETDEGALDLRRLGEGTIDELMAEVDCPGEWVVRYVSDPSGPGEYRVLCPRHSK